MAIKVPVLQVVGYQNSGKTTLIEKLVIASAERGWRVGTIKHHGHGGRPHEANVGKDSERHRRAGAKVTAVAGDDMLVLHALHTKWDLAHLLSLYERLGVDVVLVEGFKTADYPKVVMIRREEDVELLSCLSNIVAVITWIPLETTYKTYLIDEEMRYINDLLNMVRERDG